MKGIDAIYRALWSSAPRTFQVLRESFRSLRLQQQQTKTQQGGAASVHATCGKEQCDDFEKSPQRRPAKFPTKIRKRRSSALFVGPNDVCVRNDRHVGNELNMSSPRFVDTFCQIQSEIKITSSSVVVSYYPQNGDVVYA